MHVCTALDLQCYNAGPSFLRMQWLWPVLPLAVYAAFITSYIRFAVCVPTLS